MWQRRQIGWIIVATVIALCAGCTKTNRFISYSLGFSIEYPTGWLIIEDLESNTIIFERVSVEITERQSIAEDNDALTSGTVALNYLTTMASVNLESGRFVEQIESPHVVHIGDSDGARMQVVVSQLLELPIGGMEPNVIEELVEFIVIIEGDKVAIITARRPDKDTDRTIESFRLFSEE